MVDFYCSKVRQTRPQKSIVFPKVFSLIENTDESMETLNKLAHSIKKGSYTSISIDQSKVEKVDFGAETIASVFVREGFNNLKVNYEGIFPKNKEANEIIKATGLPKSLGIKRAIRERFLSFKLHHGRSETIYLPNKSPERDNAIQQFYNYLNDCLKLHAFEFDEKGKEFMMKMLGEIIENCERHSGTRDWWISGYMRTPENTSYSDVHISILNFGDTIFESLKKLDSNSLLSNKINEAVQVHKKKGHFNKNFTEEQLWTLMALQEGVSRNNNAPNHIDTNGYGTVDIIKFFQTLGKSGEDTVQPKMCILSGNTVVIHDSKYKMEQVENNSGEFRMRLAFNEENDIFEQQDTDCIKNLNNFFPGTVYSFRFYLNSEHIKSIVENATN